MCLTLSTMHEEDHSALAKKGMNNRTEQKLGEWFGVKPLSAIRAIGYVARGNYGISMLSRPLPACIIVSTMMDNAGMLC